jgi:hypothetical protein
MTAHCLDIDTLEQPAQLLGRQLDDRLLPARHQPASAANDSAAND